METPSFFERLNSWIRNSITIKLMSMGILILLLLIPAFMIQSLIQERDFTRQGAIEEVSSKWGHAQTIVGPVLMIPFKVYRTTDDDKLIETTQHAYFLPETLLINGNITPETRYRGLYEVVVYNTTLTTTGHFSPPDFSEWSIDPAHILWNEAAIAVGISDMRGIQERVDLVWNKETLSFDPGLETSNVIDAGISVRIPIDTEAAPDRYAFSFDLNLNGSQSLNFVPLGKETKVDIQSPWSTPSFDGAFLPEERTVTDEGFDAHWRVLHLNRNYPQQWRGTQNGLQASSFGVNLLLPVDQYQKSMRAAKYAILIIALTFLTFFFTEIRNRNRVHPFQYVLVGLALCLFYVLLLSLSEHMSFNLAYLLAGGATIGLVAAYSKSIFQTSFLSLVLGGILVVLYGFVFTILQLEDYALLVGALGLFLALMLTMYLSRNIDWYAMGEEPAKPAD